MVQGQERRKYARLDLALTISYRETGEHVGKMQNLREALSSDISEGGFRLMTPGKLSNGTLLQLGIILGDDDNDQISATGEVVWQSKVSDNSFETGVMIKEMPNEDKSRFMQYVFDQMSRVLT